MKCTRVLNQWIKEHNIDREVIAEQTHVSVEQLGEEAVRPYAAEEFLSLCQACNVKPEEIFKLAKEQEA